MAIESSDESGAENATVRLQRASMLCSTWCQSRYAQLAPRERKEALILNARQSVWHAIVKYDIVKVAATLVFRRLNAHRLLAKCRSTARQCS